MLATQQSSLDQYPKNVGDPRDQQNNPLNTHTLENSSRTRDHAPAVCISDSTVACDQTVLLQKKQMMSCWLSWLVFCFALMNKKGELECVWTEEAVEALQKVPTVKARSIRLLMPPSLLLLTGTSVTSDLLWNRKYQTCLILI